MAKYPELDKFYQSKEWKVFRAGWVSDYLSRHKEGLTCAWCNQPIHGDDFQLDHIEELNPDNVKDAMISLNPEKVRLIHDACHNRRHAHAGDRMRQVFLVYGPPLSGKSTLVHERMWTGDLVVDMDSLYQAVSGLPRYEKPDSLRYNVFGIRDALYEQIETRYGRWDRAWIVGGFADEYLRRELSNRLGAQQIFLDVSKEECLRRLSLSGDRNNAEWKRYIERWFDQYVRD